MRLFLFALAFIVAFAHDLTASEYGSYDIRKVVSLVESENGKQAKLDIAYMDKMIGDLARHAQSYPPQFDSAQDRQRAGNDIMALSKLLGALTSQPKADNELLLRAGIVNGFGHQMDIPNSAELATQNYTRLLEQTPEHPLGNYHFGIFLLSSAQTEKSLPYLDKAIVGGMVDANLSIGLAQLSLGNKDRARDYLERYAKLRPNDQQAATLLDALKSGKLDVKRSTGDAKP